MNYEVTIWVEDVFAYCLGNAKKQIVLSAIEVSLKELY